MSIQNSGGMKAHCLLITALLLLLVYPHFILKFCDLLFHNHLLLLLAVRLGVLGGGLKNDLIFISSRAYNTKLRIS